MTAKIRRDIAENPERYDFQDIPPDHKEIPTQEAAYEKLRPQWAKELAGAKKPR